MPSNPQKKHSHAQYVSHSIPTRAAATPVGLALYSDPRSRNTSRVMSLRMLALPSPVEMNSVLSARISASCAPRSARVSTDCVPNSSRRSCCALEYRTRRRPP
eukprot:3583868-Rhodomonas_salina.4